LTQQPTNEAPSSETAMWMWSGKSALLSQILSSSDNNSASPDDDWVEVDHDDSSSESSFAEIEVIARDHGALVIVDFPGIVEPAEVRPRRAREARRRYNKDMVAIMPKKCLAMEKRRTKFERGNKPPKQRTVPQPRINQPRRSASFQRRSTPSARR